MANPVFMISVIDVLEGEWPAHDRRWKGHRPLPVYQWCLSLQALKRKSIRCGRFERHWRCPKSSAFPLSGNSSPVNKCGNQQFLSFA